MAARSNWLGIDDAGRGGIMDTDSLQGGGVAHTPIEVIVAAHAAFNARRLDELEVLVDEDVDLFLPLSLGLTPTAERGMPALRRTLENVLRVAPDLWLELERAEPVGDLTIVVCRATATGTDDKRYEWPLRVLVAAEHGKVTRYVVRAPHADLLADKAVFRPRD
jgi:ketosteroid isomerase-like protein